MAVLTRSKIKAHLERQARMGFLNEARAYQPIRTALGISRDLPSTGAFEIYADLGDHPWPTQNAGLLGGTRTDSRTGAQEVNLMNARESVTILGGEERAMKINNIDWDIAVGIEKNAIDDGTANLENWAREAGQNFEAHKDFLAFDALRRGTGTTYGRAYDLLSFYNDSHVDPGAEYTTTYDNSYALTLSSANFKTVYVAGSKFLDSRGQPTKLLDHGLILYPVDLIDEVAQIVRNPQKDATANRDVNPFVGGDVSVRAAKVPGTWFASTTWAIVDVNHQAKPVYIQVRQQPELVIAFDEFLKVYYYIWTSRYAVFYGDPRLALLGNA